MTQDGAAVSREGSPGEPRPTGLARLALLDLMRTVALLRVVVFHVTGIDALSMVASMPVMFFVAGALYARSMQTRPAAVVVRDRYRRILPGLWAYATFLVILYASKGLLSPTWGDVAGPAGSIAQLGLYHTIQLFIPVISLGAPVGPGLPDQAVFYTWNALWYLHTHLMLSLLGVIYLRCYKRWFRATVGVLAAIWVIDALLAGGTANSWTFTAFFVAGFAFTDGRLLNIGRRHLRWSVPVLAVLGALSLPFGPGLFINQWAPALLFVGAMWVAVSLGWRELLEQVAVGRVFRPLISFVNRRALTIYLWSLLGVYLSRTWFPVEGGLLQLSGIAIASLILTAVVVLVCCILFGWIEDVSARRPAEWWPGTPIRRRAAQTGAGAGPTV
jgi:hypothetical protein